MPEVYEGSTYRGRLVVSSALPDDIRESVAIGNVKSVAEQTSMLSNLAYADLISNDNLSQQNAVSNQQGLNQLGVTVSGKINNLVSSLSPMEATAVAKLNTGNDVAEQLADIKGTLLSLKRNFASAGSISFEANL